MRLAIHAGTLRGAGSAAVGKALIEGIRPHFPGLELWCPEAWSWARGPTTHLVAGGTVAKFWFEAATLPRALDRCDTDLLLSLTDTSCPWPGRPHVLLVQQAYLAYSPGTLPFALPERFRRKLAMMAAYFRLGLPRISQFVVQTHDMRVHLAQRWHIDDQKIEVIPSGVSEPVLSRRQRRVSPQGYVLCVVSAAPHKGHGLIPDVLQALPPSCEVRITLARGDVPTLDRALEERRLRGRLTYLGVLPNSAFLTQLEQAAVAWLPSQLESFGLGYYEALALGVPVVAWDAGFSREACGDAALYGGSAIEHAERIKQLWSTEALQAEFKERARAQFDAVHVSRDVIAERYLHVMKACL